MPRWVKVVGWAALVWTVALAGAIAYVAFSGDCAGVKPADLGVCRLGRDSTISGLAMVWFIGFLPAAVLWFLVRARRERCRICGDELGAREHRLCRRCATRLIETAARPDHTHSQGL